MHALVGYPPSAGAAAPNGVAAASTVAAPGGRWRVVDLAGPVADPTPPPATGGSSQPDAVEVPAR